MLEILATIVGIVTAVGVYKTLRERRDRKALRGGDLTLEKKLLVATVKLNAIEQENEDLKNYLGLHPSRREALTDEAPPVASKKARPKKISDPNQPVIDFKGLGPSAIPMAIIMIAGGAMIAEQQKKKGQPKKAKDLKSLKARLEKKAHPAEPFSKSDKSLMELKRLLTKSGKLQD